MRSRELICDDDPSSSHLINWSHLYTMSREDWFHAAENGDEDMIRALLVAGAMSE